MANLADEFREENEHVRHVMKLLVSWYTFFITINIAAVSWLSTTNNLQPDYFGLNLGIPYFFCINTLLGIYGLFYIDRYFTQVNDRVLVMLALNDNSYIEDAFQYKNKSPIPIVFYRRTALLFLASLIILFFFWYYFFVMPANRV